jgi:putative hydrolase of the HAD superfamily
MLEGRALTRVEAIALDLDDTIFDAGAWSVAAMRRAADQRGMDSACVERAIASFLERHNAHDPAFYHAILLGCSQSDSGINVRALHEAVLTYHGQGQSWETFPGVRDALHSLRAHYKLALIADGPLEVQKAKVAALGIEKFFSHIIYTEELPGQRRRPDPRPFQLLREQFGLSGRQLLYVGDNPLRDFPRAALSGLPDLPRLQRCIPC